MRKSHAIFLLLTLVVAIGGYVAWAAWEPAPTLQSMTFHKNVDADARSAAEADFRANPPKAQKLAWKRFLNRLIHPYLPQEKLSIHVEIFPQTSGNRLLAIDYPREEISLAYSQKNGRWQRAYRYAEGNSTRIDDYQPPAPVFTDH
ncbi:MAG: hypothetical protein V4819_25020 [Verrucomicrobiota bacterium]